MNMIMPSGSVAPRPSSTTSSSGASCPSRPTSALLDRRRENSAACDVSKRIRRSSQSLEQSQLREEFRSELASIDLPGHDANMTQDAGGLTRPLPHSSVAQRSLTAGADGRKPEPFPRRASGSRPKRQRSRSVSNVAKASPTEMGKGSPGAQSTGVNRGADDDPNRAWDNGYHFPPKKPAAKKLASGLKAFWRYSTTLIGFCVVLYGLNIVAWGGMIFLLLCNAAPAMCHPSCNDIDSPRRKWIEIDAQILNALFCVTGFGLAPWRFRDLFFLLKFRLGHDTTALRRLAGIHKGWFRLPMSDALPPDLGPDDISAAAFAGALHEVETAIPYPPSAIPDPPLTGQRAGPTSLWKLDFVIWMNASNTFLQCGLSALMWGWDRYTRPSWAVGLFVAGACIVAAIAGIMMLLEGRKVKAIEGIPVTQDDLERLALDRELGIPHYNNIKDKKPKELD